MFDGVDICVCIDVGLFYGVVMLWQLVILVLVGVLLFVFIIDDVLCFVWCGLMFDLVCYMQMLDEICMLIEQMVEYKFNVLYWYFIDDQGWCIQIKCYFEFICIGVWCMLLDVGCYGEFKCYGGFYMQDEICQIVVYVVVWQIIVVLEIDMFGYVIVVVVVYLCLGVIGKCIVVLIDWGVNIMLYNLSFVMVCFMQYVLDEVMMLFFLCFIYFGGDEVVKDEWQVLCVVQV